MRRLLADRQVMRALFADPGHALAVLGRNGAVRQANQPFLALAGDTPCFAEPVASQMRAALAAGETLSATGDLLRADARIPVAVALSPAGAGGTEAVLRLTDLRPQRGLEAQLAQAQRLQAVGALAAGIAHDFNNLLTVILGATSILRDHVDAAGQDELALISESAGRGADLVRQMLAFSRQQTLQPRAVSLNGLVQAAASLLRRVLGGAVKLDLRLEEPGRQVWADPTQLDQVLMNLAVNARDAMKQGGTLTITTGHRLALTAVTEANITLPPGRYATLEVSDTGSGIPPEILPQIFDPFFTTRRGQGGTGLGLATVHGIVQQSGGHLAVSTTQGQGTCFRIFLPRLEAAARPAPAAPPAAVAPAPPAARAGRHVLLVEDEDAVRRLAALALRRAGWRVTEAASGPEALEVALPVDLLVSDVIMPGLDGTGLVQALRRRQPGLPALLMSGYADAAQRQALAAADIRFLAKPFTMAALTSAASALVAAEQEKEEERSLLF